MPATLTGAAWAGPTVLAAVGVALGREIELGDVEARVDLGIVGHRPGLQALLQVFQRLGVAFATGFQEAQKLEDQNFQRLLMILMFPRFPSQRNQAKGKQLRK